MIDKCIFIISILVLYFNTAFSQQKGKDTIPEGFNILGLPSTGYSRDIGIEYGALVNIFYYGDGSVYPDYLHELYAEWSATTKGQEKIKLTYDSKYLIKGYRLTAELNYTNEKALGFYGFNGDETYFNSVFISEDNQGYISRNFYKIKRRHERYKIDIAKNILSRKVRVLSGIEYTNTSIGYSEKDNIEGAVEDTSGFDYSCLYQYYVDWNMIKESEKEGGNGFFLKTGIIYDTRINEANPEKGIWSDLLFIYALPIKGMSFSYAKLAFTYRQYFPVIYDRLTFAGRVSYQPKLFGDIPFYMLPFVYSSDYTRDGIGSKKTVRGLLRNRVVGEDMAFGNFELRWKILKGIYKKYNYYFAFTPFFDAGMVTGRYQVSIQAVPDELYDDFFTNRQETLHYSYGAGVYLAINENFIIKTDIAFTGNKNDGDFGIYTGMDFLF